MAPLQLVFREATPGDADAVAALINGAFRVDQTNEVYVDADGDRSGLVVTSAAAVRAKLAEQDDGTAVVLVATAGSDPVLLAHATLTKREDGAVAWLGFLAVDAVHQGAGLGSQVLTHVQKHACDRWNARRLEFDVIRSRAGLRRFYELHGFRPKTAADGSLVLAPFPYAAHGDSWHGLLRADLDFVVYSKEL
ncbi:acetyltransferase [Grosmannia clavigera kw1407]|uniref:Acetyltransferase n=1 Tax=Grosmannia clavigera (strain kw1407 / UAMH 11150) TaxID=655863 RepID=F0X826_GROCL|nr:acetyltransferase [Grosmannia clavigera kw1407]EFX05842.1 acetyltransferase [Grosmannia clavigera kw1407]